MKFDPKAGWESETNARIIYWQAVTNHFPTLASSFASHGTHYSTRLVPGVWSKKLNAIEGMFCNRKGRKRTQRSRSSCLGLGRRKNPIPKSIGKSWELGKRHSKFVQYRMRFLAICNRVVSWLAPRTISNKELLKRYKNSFPRFSTGYPK